MTGAYLRVKRNGKFENIEVEFLTDEERTELFKDRKPGELIKWMNLLSKQLQQLKTLLDDLVKAGIITSQKEE